MLEVIKLLLWFASNGNNESIAIAIEIFGIVIDPSIYYFIA